MKEKRPPYLEDCEGEHILRDAPRVQFCEVRYTPRRYFRQLAIVGNSFDEFLASNTLLAQLAEKVPQTVLERDLESVGLGAHAVGDERVVGVVSLFLKSDGRQQSDAKGERREGSRYRNIEEELEQSLAAEHP
jgi:hypothetical protein